MLEINKGQHLLSKSLSLIDAAGLNETVLVKASNMVRESSSYLHHILSDYHNLPRHVVFCRHTSKILILMHGEFDPCTLF